MTNEQKTIIKSYVGSWAGYYVKLLCDKDEFLKQPDKLPDSFDRYGEPVYKSNPIKQTLQDMLKFLQINNISEEAFLKEATEIKKDQIMANWYMHLSDFTEEEIQNSITKDLNLVGENAVYEAGFSKKIILEKVEQFLKSAQVEEQIQNTVEEIKKLIKLCEDLANTHKLTFDLNICDTAFEYKQTSAGGYWYTSSRNC